jgi:lipopolysaccharide/colanic/teichoic acid biosynthesis glycosyltransferase
MKRTTDILGSLVGLVLFSPLLIVVSLLIKLGNLHAPIIFRQVRVGKNGRPFTIYKFRSMVPDAEKLLAKLKERNETSGCMFKMKDDPRVTRIGRFIRKTSIDELPQLINVLRGEMSLVGPRPPLPSEVAQYSDYHKRRLLVTPGCTGLWQVNGRSNVGFEKMVELDLEYIRERNLAMDLKIIFMTFAVMVDRKDAY